MNLCNCGNIIEFVIDICRKRCIINMKETYVRNMKEVRDMPGRDGTGPMGSGAMTGRGPGLCSGANNVKHGAGAGLGLGCKHGFGRRQHGSNNADQSSSATQKELLQNQRDMLQGKIDRINKQMGSL